MYFQIKNTHSNLDHKEFIYELARWTCHQIEHSASAFGLPRVPDEAYAPETAYGLTAKHLTRGYIARLFVDIILDKAMVEFQDSLVKKINKEGVFSLYRLLGGEPILRSMTEYIAADDINEEGVSPEQPDSQRLE